jgi:hypothetical protein
MLARRGFASTLSAGLPAALGLGYYFFLRPQMLKAGTRLGESQRRLPGDDVIAVPNFQATRAIDIDAPLEAVWMWIAQMGRERTGFYGVDSLTNRGIPSAAYIRQDLPAPQPGMAMDDGYRILDVEPNRLLLYGGFDLPTPTGGTLERTTLMLLERRRDGSTRLLSRSRGYTYGALGPFYNLVYEMLDYFNGTAQLENIRQRAETMAHLRVSASA